MAERSAQQGFSTLAVHAGEERGGAGARLVAAADLYGGTLGLLNRVMAPLGLETCFVDVTDHAAVRAALAERPAVALLLESVSNPLLKVSDVAALAELAHAAGARCL